MNEKIKIYDNLDVLVKMCRAKGDEASLRIEEEEITDKLKDIEDELSEINSTFEEDCYDSSAEMADRNIEIITKKQLNTLKSEIKNQTQILEDQKKQEKDCNIKLTDTKDSIKSCEEYNKILSERLEKNEDTESIESLKEEIESNEKIVSEKKELLSTLNEEYTNIQKNIESQAEKVQALNKKVEQKELLLDDTQNNLAKKESYIDASKKARIDRKINQLSEEKANLEKRLNEIQKDPKYLEGRIKEIISKDEDPFNARPYIISLIDQAIKQPYMNIPNGNALEEKLLKATRDRDTFANEVDHKAYGILEVASPYQIRVDYLEKRIQKWNEETEALKEEIKQIDKDEQFNFRTQSKELIKIIESLKIDVKEYTEVYEKEKDSNISQKAKYKSSLDDKKSDLINAERLLISFRKEEQEELQKASNELTNNIKELQDKISKAELEIVGIKSKLMTSKSGLIDIATMNKDKEHLKELAKVVIDIKHKKQFSILPIDIAKNLEILLNLSIIDSLNQDYKNIDIEEKDSYKENDSKSEEKDFEPIIIDSSDNKEDNEKIEEPKEHIEQRGIKVTNTQTIQNQPISDDEKIEIDNLEEEPKEILTLEEEPISVQESETSKEEPKPIIEEPIEEINEVEMTPIISEDDNDDIGLLEKKDIDLSINSIFNAEKDNTPEEKSDNIISNENLADELDQYLNNINTNKEAA